MQPSSFLSVASTLVSLASSRHKNGPSLEVFINTRETGYPPSKLMTPKTGLPSLLDSITPMQLVLRRRLLIHLTVFIFLELAFIALALVCLRTPLPCSLSSSTTFTKAVFTALFIVWQTIAVMSAQNLVFHVFSSEWYTRFTETGKLTPGYTDIVSTAMSGFLDRFRYFFGHNCSQSYRLAFITSLMLIALPGLAPGSITVEDVQQFEPSTLAITNITAAVNGSAPNSLLLQSWIITQLELQGNTTFKFKTQEHVIVGWPNIEPGQLTGDIKFQSDVLLYNVTCQWEAPSFNMSQWGTTWYAGEFGWYPWMPPLDGEESDGGRLLLPLSTTILIYILCQGWWQCISSMQTKNSHPILSLSDFLHLNLWDCRPIYSLDIIALIQMSHQNTKPSILMGYQQSSAHLATNLQDLMVQRAISSYPLPHSSFATLMLIFLMEKLYYPRRTYLLLFFQHLQLVVNQRLGISLQQLQTLLLGLV